VVDLTMRATIRLVLLSLAVAACVTVTPADVAGPSHRTMVGVSWGDFLGDRWKADLEGMLDALGEAGVPLISRDAHGSSARQATDIAELITLGVDALIVVAQEAETIGPSIRSALDAGIPVIGYDRLIADPDVFYLSFDNVEVGRLQARAVLAAAPQGRYVLVKGDPGDPNTELLAAGQAEVLGPAIESGEISIVAEASTQGWREDVAWAEMERVLSANGGSVEAVVASNDSTAGGVVGALAARGLAGRVPVSGQDGDRAALNRVALGTQTVTVWKDGRELGRAAGRIAVQLVDGVAVRDVPAATAFDAGDGTAAVSAILLEPTAITRGTLAIVLDAGWITPSELCRDVPSGTIPVCP
jgi:D-xylose transport system substrate-binding protein